MPEFAPGLLCGLLGAFWVHTQGYCWHPTAWRHLRAGVGQAQALGEACCAEQEAQGGQPHPPCLCPAWLVDGFKCFYLRFWRMLLIFKIRTNCSLGHMDTPGWPGLPWIRHSWYLPRFRLSPQAGMTCPECGVTLTWSFGCLIPLPCPSPPWPVSTWGVSRR